MDKLTRHGSYLASLIFGALVATLMIIPYINDHSVWIVIAIAAIWIMQVVRIRYLEDRLKGSITGADVDELMLEDE